MASPGRPPLSQRRYALLMFQMLQINFSSKSPPLRFRTTSAFFCPQHIAHQALATGCENDVVVIQFIAHFADKMESRSINETITSALSRAEHYGLAYIGCCWTLVWISFEQINGVVVSFAIACRKETITPLICLERKQHFGWRGVCSTTHHPWLWLELGLISSIPWSSSRSHESWVMFH